MDMKKLIEKMDQFAGQAVGQKPGDQVRGTEKATPKKSGKHPFAGRLVGSSESKNMLADLEKELVEGAVKRGLKEEFEAFKAKGVAEGKGGYQVVDEMGRIYSQTNRGLLDALEAAQELANHHNQIFFVNNPNGDCVHVAKPGEDIHAEQGVAEGAPELLKAEIPLVRQIEKEMAAHGYEKGTEEYKKVFDHMLSFHRKFGNADRINQPNIEEGMTPDNMFLDKASRVKEGDQVVYKGKVVGIATGEVKNGQILFKPTEGEYAKNMDGIATLPIDEIYLKEDANPRIDLTPNYPNYSTLIGEFVGVKGQRVQFKIVDAELKPGQGETEKIVKALETGKPILVDISRVKNRKVMEHIVKHGSEYRLLSHKGKNLGDFPSHAAAEKHEREVQYFKHAHEDVDEARIFHSDSKVNLFYKPDSRMSKAQIVAKLIPTSKIDKYIEYFVEKFGVQPSHFEWKPASRDEYEHTEESLGGEYIPPPGEASAGDSHSPSPVGSLEEDQQDTVTMDVPFLIRVMEYAREDATTDMDLHSAVEKMISAQESADSGILTMDSYDSIFGAEQGVAEGFEPGHREIERWAKQSEENQKIYNAYIRAGKMADEAHKQNDGASYTGLQLRKKQIRDLIAKKMSEQGVAEDSNKEEFGYKKLHPEIFKARQKYPAAKSDMEALIMAVRDEEAADVDRIDKVNDREDRQIDSLDHEEDYLQQQIKSLKAQLGKLEAMATARNAKTAMEEDVPPAVATAGGPAGATQPKQTPPGQPVDPAQVALQKQQQSKLQQNIANLKTAGVQVDPAKAAQTLQKTDTGAPMNAMDKDTIAKLAPAIGNVMSNPSTATQFNTLIKKAGGGA